MQRIRKVTDMRSGLIHPRREWNGRFMGRKVAAQVVRYREIILRRMNPVTLPRLIHTFNVQAEK